MSVFSKAGVVLVSLSLSIVLVLSSCSKKSNPVSVTEPPGTPALSLPADADTNQPTTITLKWATVSSATSYRIQVSTESAFLSPFLDSWLAADSAIVPWLFDSTTYYWRVCAKNGAGMSTWSDPWNFKTINFSFFEFGRTQGGYLGYWTANDPDSSFTWLYNFKRDSLVISEIQTVIDTINFDITYDTVETYRGVFVLNSAVTPNAMDIHLTTGQTIQTIYALQPVMGSFVECYVMKNDPGAPRPTYMPDPSAQPPDPNINKLLPLMYAWAH